MSREILLYAEDADSAAREIEAAGGRILLGLSPHLIVAVLPDDADPGGLGSVTEDLPELEGAERVAAEAWIERFGQRTTAEGRRARAAAEPVVPWDAPGRTPPDHTGEPGGPVGTLPAGPEGPPGTVLPGSDTVPPGSDTLPPGEGPAVGPRSTNTPTSVVMTGKVAVGVVVVSGPATPPYWFPLHGALIHVAASSTGEVWGVNAAHEIFRLDGTSWTKVAGALRQVSVGAKVWGVNAQDEIYRRDGTAWTRVPGALRHVSAAEDGTVWGVNAQHSIYRWDGSAWTQVPGALTQVSAGSASTVWGVNADGEIYQWTGAAWSQVPGALRHVAAAADGSVYGVNADDEIYRYLGGGNWEQLDGRLAQISAASASVQWGVNAEEEIFRHDPNLNLVVSGAERRQIVAEVLEGLAFLGTAGAAENVSFQLDLRFPTVDVATGTGHDYEPMEAPWRDAALTQLGFEGSRDGSVDYVTSIRSALGATWAYVGYFTKYPTHHFAYAGRERIVMEYANDGWGPAEISRVFAHETCHIFGAADEYGGCSCDASGHHGIPNLNCRNCTSAQVPCLMEANTLVLCPWSRGQVGWRLWIPVAGALKHVSAGADGTVWGVNAADRIYRWTGSAWQQVPGALSQISVGDAAHVWGVNSAGKIYRWNGSSWTQVSGALRHVSAASDGTVWGVNSADRIYRRDGNAWTQIPGALRQVSAGSAGRVWGVNSAGSIYQWNGASWTHIAGALRHVSVAADGTVWGVNASDTVYHREANAWRQFPGALKQVSVGAAGRVWGVNAGDAIFRQA
ncbi:tectonin domain-containing protein [Sinomonas mesophila]|uniref:tectonin domain-containing protein n=1 Tax=Sinomonas mesophila TaxID=1531955 RepID=UPI0009862E50|nr:tectonin domain-containing protein [Sinomonas mesophila]